MREELPIVRGRYPCSQGQVCGGEPRGVHTSEEAFLEAVGVNLRTLMK